MNSVLCPEVHRARYIQDIGSNKHVECHVLDKNGNTRDNILSRGLPVQFPQTRTDILSISAISYFPLMCVILCIHTLRSQSDSDTSHPWR